jgi:hypothetical protein
MTEYTPGEPDRWTWPDADDCYFDERDRDGVCDVCHCDPCDCPCAYCGGEEWVFGPDGIGIPCPECG